MLAVYTARVKHRCLGNANLHWSNLLNIVLTPSSKVLQNLQSVRHDRNFSLFEPVKTNLIVNKIFRFWINTVTSKDWLGKVWFVLRLILTITYKNFLLFQLCEQYSCNYYLHFLFWLYVFFPIDFMYFQINMSAGFNNGKVCSKLTKLVHN